MRLAPERRTASEALRQALRQPAGARFFKCALQVNPFAYAKQYRNETRFPDEDSYNRALVEACVASGIEVAALTDHYRVEGIDRLAAALRACNVTVFPGFEAETSDGVHYLIIFDPSTHPAVAGGRIHQCGGAAAPNPDLTSAKILEQTAEWNAVGIAAHIAYDKGLFRALDSAARARVWQNRDLLAASINGGIDDQPPELIPFLPRVLRNQEPAYERPYPMALINAQDIAKPEDAGRPGTWTWIRMSHPTINGLRQAFYDPQSRIRLSSETPPPDRSEIVALAWEGGDLDGERIHFSESLNALIGGRGTGKSTVIESLRYALNNEPAPGDARKMHQGIVSNVLRSGTKISVLVRSPHPSADDYTIERTVPDPPVVRNAAGELLNLTPRDVFPATRFFSQHELAEIARDPREHTRLLERFVPPDPALDRRYHEIREAMARSRNRLRDLARERSGVEERLAALPGLEEQYGRYVKSGLEDRVKDQTLLVREERLLEETKLRLDGLEEVVRTVGEAVPIDVTFLTDRALEELPGAALLSQLRAPFARLDQALQKAHGELAEALAGTRAGVDQVQEAWASQRRGPVEEAFQKLLRELHKEKIDGKEIVDLRRQIEALRPLHELGLRLDAQIAATRAERQSLRQEWVEVKRERFQRLDRTAKRISRKTEWRLRIDVIDQGDRDMLEELLRQRPGGNLAATINRLREAQQLSLVDLADACREGREALVARFDLPSLAADKIAQAGEYLAMEIEELELPARTAINLNTASRGEESRWQPLERLSAGQKATALLLLALLDEEGPLVIDQPEDDLDNRFIHDEIVQRIREAKGRRQLILSSHNANIPVLGDAELVLGMEGAAGASGQPTLHISHRGSIDDEDVKAMIETVLEGGKDAFEKRRRKYGYDR